MTRTTFIMTKPLTSPSQSYNAIFAREDVLHYIEASVNVFYDAEVPNDIGSSDGAWNQDKGRTVQISQLYFSTKTAANILSYAAIVSATYYQPSHTCTLISKGGEDSSSFKRKYAPGSEGRFYCCDKLSREHDRILVETLADDMRVYSR